VQLALEARQLGPDRAGACLAV